jgi:hypothetical protein
MMPLDYQQSDLHSIGMDLYVYAIARLKLAKIHLSTRVVAAPTGYVLRLHALRTLFDPSLHNWCKQDPPRKCLLRNSVPEAYSPSVQKNSSVSVG